MIEVRCPHCGAIFHIHASRTRQRLPCPDCGRHFTPDSSPAPTVDGEVIDVKAEVIGGEPEPEFPPHHGRDAAPWEGMEDPSRPRVYTWHVEQRGGGGSGCCMMGCLLLLVLVALAIQGLYSFLSG